MTVRYWSVNCTNKNVPPWGDGNNGQSLSRITVTDNHYFDSYYLNTNWIWWCLSGATVPSGEDLFFKFRFLYLLCGSYGCGAGANIETNTGSFGVQFNKVDSSHFGIDTIAGDGHNGGFHGS